MCPGIPFSAFRSSATNWVTYFRMQCASDRTGKWRISIGYQPRSATRPCSERLVVPAADANVGRRAVSGLEVDAERMRVEAGRAEPRRHALGEEAVVVGTRHEVAPGAAHDAEPLRHRGEELAEVSPARPPELVRVRVEDPVRAELGRGHAGHARDPLRLAEVLAGLADEMQLPSRS